MHVGGRERNASSCFVSTSVAEAPFVRDAASGMSFAMSFSSVVTEPPMRFCLGGALQISGSILNPRHSDVFWVNIFRVQSYGEELHLKFGQ